MGILQGNCEQLLRGKETLIGRTDPKSGIFVDVDLTAVATAPKVISRRHARIEQEGNRFYLTDLGSANGTKLNGRRPLPMRRHPSGMGMLLNSDGMRYS